MNRLRNSKQPTCTEFLCTNEEFISNIFPEIVLYESVKSKDAEDSRFYKENDKGSNTVIPQGHTKARTRHK